MKERPIIFNTEMVRAILEGRKTQTRRPFKKYQIPQLNMDQEMVAEFPDTKYEAVGQHDKRYGFMVFGATEEECAKSAISPYGRRGDRLWVRETWCDPSGTTYPILYKSDLPLHWDDSEMGYPVDLKSEDYKWRPSIHMPHEYSRITLEIVNVRVEKLQDITYKDAWAEGIEAGDDDPSEYQQYRMLWDSIYGNWDDNPWVWVIEFKRIK